MLCRKSEARSKIKLVKISYDKKESPSKDGKCIPSIWLCKSLKTVLFYKKEVVFCYFIKNNKNSFFAKKS